MKNTISSQIPMAKIYPRSLLSSSSSSRREVLTVWMKSLVMNGNGCTVYDSDGHIVYRVDNYDHKCSDEVYLMDQNGRTLTKILRKKLSVFGRWEGYRCNTSILEESKPWFHVQKACRILNRDQSYEHRVMAGCGSVNPICYRIVGSANKSEYRIMDMAGGLMAEVKMKNTVSGVALGNDVLTLVVESDVDRLLIMGLVIVCGLINHSL